MCYCLLSYKKGGYQMEDNSGRRGLFLVLLIGLVMGASAILAAYILGPETIAQVARAYVIILTALAIAVGVIALCRAIMRNGKK